MTIAANEYVNNIRNAGLTIHSPITIGDPNLWIPDEHLEYLLNEGLRGRHTESAIKTRSKTIREWICAILGYPIEKSFPRKRPKFTGQNFDVYAQQSNNFQVWNQEISPQRRYVIVGQRFLFFRRCFLPTYQWLGNVVFRSVVRLLPKL